MYIREYIDRRKYVYLLIHPDGRGKLFQDLCSPRCSCCLCSFITGKAVCGLMCNIMVLKVKLNIFN